jgi:hypothetical protein
MLETLTLDGDYLSPMSPCSSATIAAISSEVNLTLVFTFYPLSILPYYIVKDYNQHLC